MPRTTKRAQPLMAIPEDEAVAEPEQAERPDVLALIDELERNVEERVHAIMAAASDAVLQLKSEFTKLLVKLPKKTRDMPLAEFKKQYPQDFQTGALAQIGQKFAAMKEEIEAKQAPTGRVTRTAVKRAAEPETVLRTTRRRAAAQPAAFDNPGTAAVEGGRKGRSQAAADGFAAAPLVMEAAPAAGTAARGNFNGRPLQTPMPFAGEAMQAAVTLLTQRRGGRTRGAAATDAAVITTSDGQQWAVGKQGLSSIPESHRGEVQELLNAQFEFFAAALGKTVFARGRR
ncbi:hypothetical protein N2152v2_005787 [Parachlorella kessleri]